jgi:peroxiredoxin
VDPVEQNAKVVQELKLSFPILADTEGRVLDVYDLRHDEGAPDGGAIARPATFVIDRDGIVRWRNLTESFRLRPSPDDVLAAVVALGPQ